ncbi:MAG TPA: DUF2244 domain-containing protein [Xanthobacteraceae bacterium]
MHSDNNAVLPEPKIFCATITPHRSLTPRGFHLLMLGLAVLSVGSGVLFVSIGAWPVFGFFGFDVLLLYVALRANFRAARAYEEVTITPSELTVRKVSHRGGVREWTLNPVWVQLERIAHAEFGIERLFLVSHGRRLLIAAALGPDEKASFARALSTALGEAKRGPTRTVFD